MADEQVEQQESIADIRRRMQSRRYDPADDEPDETDTVDETEAEAEPDADEPAEDEETGADEEAAETEDEPSDDAESETVEGDADDEDEGGPEESAEREGAESDEPTDAGRPEGEQPPAAEEPDDEADPIILEFHGGQTFRRSDLDDPERLEQYRQAVAAGLEMKADYQRKTAALAQHRQQVEQANAVLEQRGQLMREMYADEDMQKVLAEFGNDPFGDGVTLTQRLLQNPTEARRILTDPAAKERLWDKMEALRANPGERETIAAFDRQRRQSEEYQQRDEVQRAAYELQSFVGALDQTIDSFATHYEVPADDITEFVLNVAGLSPQDLVDLPNQPPAVQDRVTNGLLMLKQMHLRPQPDGSGYVIDPKLIERECRRLQKLGAAGSEASEGGAPKKGKSSKAEEHNAAVDRKLADDDPDPVPVPSGTPPGEPVEDEAEDFKAIRNRIQARGAQARR